MPTMKAMQVEKTGGDFKLAEKKIPTPASDEILIKVQACGVCHSDETVKEETMPVDYPRVPGHEVVGIVESLGNDVTLWEKGQRVGVG